MPREQIVFPRVYEHRLVADDGGPVPEVEIARADSFVLPHVTWHGGAPDGWVQMMFTVDRPFLDKLLRDLPKDQDYVEIHSEVLDRAAANRLIRFARRARDAAYGKDE